MRSGRADSISFTPAANTNSDSSALYTEGSGRPTSPSPSATPCSASVVSFAFSAEKQTPRISWPRSRRSLSLAVTTATRAPARENAARMVPQRR
jgi:hypothetical protein